jgi:hypothetical protein
LVITHTKPKTLQSFVTYIITIFGQGVLLLLIVVVVIIMSIVIWETWVDGLFLLIKRDPNKDFTGN